MVDKYILDGRIPVPCTDLLKWGRWMENRQACRVAENLVEQPVGGPPVRVSTVFLGLDHNFGFDGGPVLFKTMIFGGTHDMYQARYQTWEQAEAGHERAVALAKGEA